MREIKFRGKDCSDQWVYGDLIHKRHTKESVLIQDYTGLGSDVDIITIGQYTGLKDKNGKEIYEGDIILWRNQKYVVKFQSGMFYASVEEFNKDVYGGFPLWGLVEYHVEYHDEPDCGVIVGNIYEYKEEEK